MVYQNEKHQNLEQAKEDHIHVSPKIIEDKKSGEYRLSSFRFENWHV